MKKGKFNVLVDLQWGSSGKGKFCTYLAKEFGATHLSGSNRPNAGHTVVMGDRRFVAKALPSAAILNNWDARRICVWLSPGACFNVEQLQKEYDHCDRPELYIHELAQILTNEDKLGEALTVAPISSTLQGSGYAMVRKIMRHSQSLVRNSKLMSQYGLGTQLFGSHVRSEIPANMWLHECAQGWALSLDHGQSYPHVTSRNCGVAAALDQMAVAPDQVGDVYGIFRPYPIRVGSLPGQSSGDVFPDSHEITWGQVGLEANMPAKEIVELSTRELTTVTGRLRRVFTFSEEGLKGAIEANGVTALILNFAQYIDWQDHQVTRWEDLSSRTRTFIDRIESLYNVPVELVGTGEDYQYVAAP